MAKFENDMIVKIYNRDNGSVGYTIPEMNNLHRRFTSGETKEVTYQELRQLSYMTGGMTLLKDYLTILDKDVANDLLGTVEPEYYYTEQEVKELLEHGSLEQLEDCLNFAPAGVIDLIKSIAVKIELPDNRKRQMLLEKTGFNVTNALFINQQDDDGETPVEQPTVRKAKPIAVVEESDQVTRKAPSYKVVNKG